MAYNEHLADRVREKLAFSTKHPVEEKKMMGGLTFMVNDKMCVGVLADDLMCRIDPADYESALEKHGCRQMDFTGRPMKGFVFIGSEGTAAPQELNYWVDLSLKFNDKAKSSKKKAK